MKARLTFSIILGGSIGCSLSAGAIVAGCSNNGSPESDGGSKDVTVDVQAEVGIDASGDADASAGDASSEASDSSDFADIGDVQIDVPPLSAYPNAVTEAYCRRLQQCCLVPDSQWNQDGVNGCAPFLDEYGGALHVGTYSAALDSGLVGYDASAAYACLHEFLSFNCGTISAASIDLVKNSCFAAMIGTLGVDAGPCVNSLECAAGEFCRIVNDAGSGACAALGGIGQPCTDTKTSTDCSYLGNGVPALYCAAGDGGATCQPAQPLDAGCGGNAQCQSGVCNPPACVNTYVFSDPGVAGGTCEFFTLPIDAGGGG